MAELSVFTRDYAGERLSGVVAGPPGGTTALLLHGAGNSDKERLLPLLEEFAERGCRALAFDFSGHGGSSGALAESSLRRRCEQAVAVLDDHAPAGGPLVLVGFSMSGQTVADLVRRYGSRVAAVGLCAPAVYAPEAWDVPFGDGRGPFSAIIRTPGSWRGSPALGVFGAYEGRAVLAVPGTDAVIPPAVTRAVQNALSARADYSRLELPGAGHRLGQWFRDHPADRRAFVTSLLRASRPSGAGGRAVSVEPAE